MAPGFKETLMAAAAAVGVHLTAEQAEVFRRYKEILAAANRALNLTAIPEDRYIQDHFIDSLSLLQAEKIKDGQTVADVGAGAGFPGVPIKIALAGVKLHLIEANAKKAAFLRRLTAELGLKGVVVEQIRAEEAGRRPELREQMQAVVARAVASLPVLLEYALPLCKPGGWFLSLKGPRVDEELASARLAAIQLGGRVESVYVPYGRPEQTKRVVVLVAKVGPTAEKYPRRAGVPAKRPLGG